jgi:acetyl-CoA carboxylase biotin carboxyl carrier protein
VVSEDTVVAIVETMKLMNPVHAAARGRVAEICVGNAEPVVQGAVLLRIDPEPT